MKAKTIKAYSIKDIIKEINRIISNDFKPTLAIVFLSITKDWKVISDVLDKKDIVVFGATTSGEFIDGDIEEGSIVIMLLDINPEYFKSVFLETGTETTFENAKQIGLIGKETFKNPAFLIVSGWLTEEGENIVEGITEGSGKDVTIFGGMAGDDLSR